MQPEIEAPAAAAQAANGREMVRRAADEAASYADPEASATPLPAPWRSIGEVARDVLDKLFEEHFCPGPPKPLADRFYAAVTPTVAGDALVHMARVRFESHRFDFDEGGRWAVVAPIFEDEQIVDWAAFDVDNPELRRAYGLTHFAVGLGAARWDAHYRPQRRLFVHYSVWTWLRAECVGLLPFDWNTTALFIKSEGYDLHFDNKFEGKKIERKLRAALAMPGLFVRKAAAG